MNDSPVDIAIIMIRREMVHEVKVIWAICTISVWKRLSKDDNYIRSWCRRYCNQWSAINGNERRWRWMRVVCSKRVTELLGLKIEEQTHLLMITCPIPGRRYQQYLCTVCQQLMQSCTSCSTTCTRDPGSTQTKVHFSNRHLFHHINLWCPSWPSHRNFLYIKM